MRRYTAAKVIEKIYKHSTLQRRPIWTNPQTQIRADGQAKSDESIQTISEAFASIQCKKKKIRRGAVLIDIPQFQKVLDTRGKVTWCSIYLHQSKPRDELTVHQVYTRVYFFAVRYTSSLSISFVAEIRPRIRPQWTISLSPILRPNGAFFCRGKMPANASLCTGTFQSNYRATNCCVFMFQTI